MPRPLDYFKNYYAANRDKRKAAAYAYYHTLTREQRLARLARKREWYKALPLADKIAMRARKQALDALRPRRVRQVHIIGHDASQSVPVRVVRSARPVAAPIFVDPLLNRLRQNHTAPAAHPVL